MRLLRIGLMAFSTIVALAALPRPAVADDATTCEKELGDVAIEACTRAIRTGRYKGRDLAILYDNRGVEYAHKKDYERAFADYNQSLRIDPAFPSAYSNRGNAWNVRGDLDRALTDYNEAIRLNPRFANAYYNRGRLWEAKREFQRALADFTEFALLAPSDPDGPRAVERVKAALNGK